MKYYLEYKDKEEFDKINDYYNMHWSFIDPTRKINNYPPGFIIENDKAVWKYTSNPAPTDVKKITFKEWEEMINPKLEWKTGAYVKYLGTKEGKNSGFSWEYWFKNKGLIAGDVGIIYTDIDVMFEIKDDIRDNTTGAFTKEDVQLITKEEYEAGLRNPTKSYDFNEGDLVVVTLFGGVTTWINHWFKPGEILKLGGKFWNATNHKISDINNFKSFAAISKEEPIGNGMTTQSGFEFRHATPEEIAYYNKVGLGANINDMNQKDENMLLDNDMNYTNTYYREYKNGHSYIFTKNNILSLHNKDYYKEGYPDSDYELLISRLATPDEDKWLEKCIEAGRYVNKDSSNICPYKVGDLVTILTLPLNYTSLGGGTNGRNKVIYPYTFIVQKIQSDNYHTALIDSQNYGWSWQDKHKNNFILNTQKVETPHTPLGNSNEEYFPYKIGDEITILKRPESYADDAGGINGLDYVFYPYTFTIKKIVKNGYYHALFDGEYGWCYKELYKDIFTFNSSNRISLRETISNQVKEESSKEEEPIFKLKKISKIKLV